jgi:hypothetical protein
MLIRQDDNREIRKLSGGSTPGRSSQVDVASAGQSAAEGAGSAANGSANQW